MFKFRNSSLSAKLTALTAIVTTVALLIASTAYFLYSASLTKKTKVDQLTTLGQVLGSNASAAISFSQNESAAQLLLALDHYPTITNAKILDDSDVVFASYDRSNASEWDLETVADQKVCFTSDGYLEVSVPILDGEEVIGKLCLRDSLSDLSSIRTGYVKLCGAVILLALVFGIASTLPLQKHISKPILDLASATQRISDDLDFSLRVRHDASDEIGVLYREFNSMIERLQQRTIEAKEARKQLESLNEELEARVASRTEMLATANHTLQEKIKERDAANEELKQMQTRLIETSRKAGMADVANGVLHNIGNVLNSLNVSAALVDERVRGLAISRMEQSVALMEQQGDKLGEFLGNSPKGKLLPAYLRGLATQFQADRESICREISSLSKHVDHIKDIVRAQQSYAGSFGVIESCEPHQLFEDALSFVSDSVARHNIRLIKDFEPMPPVELEKARLIQMLVNLIKNAKESVLMCENSEPSITLRLRPLDGDRVRFEVSDTGTGISPDQLTRIFTQGFTTKAHGHGFGLHASANLAKEMGGTLSVQSDGVGLGATFSIDLPRTAASRRGPSRTLVSSTDSDAIIRVPAESLAPV